MVALSIRYLQLLSVLITVLLMVFFTVSCVAEKDNDFHADQSQDVKTEVDPFRTNCTTSYKTLLTELLNNDANYFNLQTTFFPSNTTSPDFVTVTYKYGTDAEMDMNETRIWFWSSAMYFFYHPIRIFQFTSFVFSDPMLRECTLTLYLPTECANASVAFMMLLTQRLKLYTMHPKITAPIDSNYQANSHSIDTLIDWHKTHGHVSRLVLSAQVILPLLVTLIMTLFFVYIIELEPRNYRKKLNLQINSSSDYISATGKSKIILFLTISVLFNFCALLTDGYALRQYDELSPEVKKYFFHKTPEFQYLYSIPKVMMGYDCLSLLFILVPLVVVARDYYRTTTDNGDRANSNTNWSCLLYTLLSPFSCIATHAYHIIIAFIDNPYHASSVLFLYVVILFMHVVVYQKIYYYILKWTNTPALSACCKPIKENKYSWLLFLFSCYILGTVTLSTVIGLTVSMLVLLPIDNAIDNAPANIYAIYQGSVAVIAALLTFQVFFRETNSIAEVFLKAADEMDVQVENWERMSGKEKEIHLAKKAIEYVINNQQAGAVLGDQQQAGAALGDQQQAGAALGDQQQAGAALGNQQPAEATLRDPQPAEATLGDQPLDSTENVVFKAKGSKKGSAKPLLSSHKTKYSKY